MKYAWIDTQRSAFPLPVLCDALSVSQSGFRAWQGGGTPDRKRLTDGQALVLIRTIHQEVRQAYGARRIHAELRGRGYRIGLPRIERLMRENGIRARHKRRYKATTDSRHTLPVAPNVLDRHFTPDAPNRVWTGDITYIATAEGWLYLAVVIDLFNREVIGWSIKPRMTTDLVLDALSMAWFRRRPEPGVLFHSDRGSPVRQSCLPGPPGHLRDARIDVTQGQLLGQRPDREFLQQPQERAGARRALRDARRGCERSVPVHRRVLQPEPPPLHPGIPVPDHVPAELDQTTGSARNGSMRATGWKTENTGHLMATPMPLAQQRTSMCIFRGAGSPTPAALRH